MSEPKYIVGIDLGTTNTIAAYTEVALEKGKHPEIKVLEIPQLVDAGTVEKKSILPSFIYVPGKHEVAEGALNLPWEKTPACAVGEFAKSRGVEIPDRLISSSKSWLCNSMVDRNTPLLPWEGSDEVEKYSPVAASALVLAHIRDAWNHTMASDDEQLTIDKQDVYLTVPASFDAVAKDLTIKAAKEAGMENVTLLEEPQAAFYAWIEFSKEAWREEIHVGDLVLVCDVGGGTSDFSLIQVTEEAGDLVLERVAVGDHLLVGGDNMDLALAYTVSGKLAQKGKKLDAWQMRGLGHSCRKAKEILLSDAQTSSCPITILGRGSGLIGGTLKTTLENKEVVQLVLDGFFPFCKKEERPKESQRTGLREFGLSYEADPGITRHLAKFLTRNETEREAAKMPTAVFFNGGVMKASATRKRVLEVITAWLAEGDVPVSDQEPVREIPTQDFDLSVARGAAYYGLARRGKAIRIRGGLARTYYMGLETAMPAVPGMPAPLKALCVAPFGMEEGTEVSLKDREFMLVVGEPVKFEIMVSSNRLDDPVGQIIEEWGDEIEALTSIETQLDGTSGSFIPVTIEIKVTEIGTLEFWCVSKNDDSRWKLEFNVREKE